jgi:ssDNA-binding Zn-finger/Zn-ribbon topoisomerase 1
MSSRSNDLFARRQAQEAIARGETDTPQKCPRCHRTLSLKTRNSDGHPFLACTGFPLHCRYTRNVNTSL